MNDETKPADRSVDERGEPVRLGEYNGFEVYPMPMFATLAAEDPSALAAWYEEALGFASMFAGPVIHLRRAKYQDLLVVRGAPPAEGMAAPVLSFHVEEIDALAARARAIEPQGSSSVEGPVDTPWNTRDLRVTDPVGHRLVFTARRAEPDPEISRRWQEAFEVGRRAAPPNESSRSPKSDLPA